MTRVKITNSAHGFQISSVLPFCDVFSFKLLSGNNAISLAIWYGKHLKIFQMLGRMRFLLSLKKFTRAY